MRRGVGTAKPIDSVVKTASKNSFASPIEPIRKVLLEASEVAVFVHALFLVSCIRCCVYCIRRCV